MGEKVNSDIKKRWVNALRSGKYVQIEGHLHDGEKGFCCLGVLTDLYLEENGTKEQKELWKVEGCLLDRDLERQVYYLGEEVRDWAGLYYADPAVKTNEGRRFLTSLNDHNNTFEQIANWIEEGL